MLGRYFLTDNLLYYCLVYNLTHLFQEYVDTPKEIVLKLDKPTKRLTRSSSLEVSPDSTDGMKLLLTDGQYYSVKADLRDFKEGYCVAKAVESSADYFVGIYLHD